MRKTMLAALALALGGCATTYDLAVMPRDSGKIYAGYANDVGNGEGPISITIENKTYNGTWVQLVPERATGFVTGGFGFGRWGRWGGFGGLGTTVTIENPQGGQAKALLTAADGTGLRCDFRNGQGRGGGTCRDDRGREYDVQVRPGHARG